MNNMIKFALFFMVSFHLWAGNNVCETDAITVEDVINEVEHLVQNWADPEERKLLQSITIQTEVYNKPSSVHIKTNPTSFAKYGKSALFHCIEFSQEFLNCPPSPKGVTSILAHELFHIIDYKTRSRLNLAWKYITNTAKYERSTDKRVIELGPDYIQGLIDYRHWIYGQIKKNYSSKKKQKKELRKKRKQYYTPEELKSILDNSEYQH